MAGEVPTTGIEVRYDLRDVLDGIRKEQAAGFAEMRTAMASKADKADVAEMRATLDSHQRDIQSLKDAHQADTVRKQTAEEHEGKFLTRAEKKWAVIGYVALILATTVGPLIGSLASGH